MGEVLTSNEIRAEFLTYFQMNQHEIIPSSSLIPANDPTLLFTNAGMVQFKDVFLGLEERPYQRAVSAQRCVRAGGKHNDLERVGYTARHHTFFEMLGNFSFGDYFKREAIRLSWEFLTRHLKIPVEKLWITVYEEDLEAEQIWLQEVKVDPKRFTRCGKEDNFWAMGPTGPCGPCTEIFYDHGEHVAGGPPGSATADEDRYVEIWNLVFMQFNRSTDGTLTPLPKPSVDTGMGLERITAVMQGVTNNYDTDLFVPLIQATAALAGIKELKNFSLQVIADHIRSCSFLITDGVAPSNEGRGYVLRRIIRRALRHGHKLNMPQPFFYRLVPILVEMMGSAYPELKNAQAQVEKVLRQEEEMFSSTLSQGLKLFDQIVMDLAGDIIPGEVVFKLYDTYGFPADLTADMARERHLMIDYEGFESAMSMQRERSRQASQFTSEYVTATHPQTPTIFTGHDDEALKTISKIIAIYREGKFVETLEKGQKGSIILDKTPFYAESGGQIGDQGLLKLSNEAIFKVHDTIKQGQTHLHLGKVERGTFHVNDEVTAEVDQNRRAATVLNHTATHILHMVLKQVLGEHALQKGSLVAPERLRFDFAHHTALTSQELATIETKVNEEIRANREAIVKIMTPDEAIASGAVALFGEKYGSKVRVVYFGGSIELCGGTHADRTGNIGLFKILSETGIASGVRRIEAVTGDAALNFIENNEREYQQKLQQNESRVATLEKDIEQLKDKLAYFYSRDLLTDVKSVNDINVLVKRLEGVDGKALRSIIDHLKTHLQSAIIILATTKNNKIGVVCGVTENLTARFSAKSLVDMITQEIGGKGGGRADLAEGGGSKPHQLPQALQKTIGWIETQLNI